MNNIINVNPLQENLNQDKIEIQRKQQQEYKFLGSLRKQKGHIIFEYNSETKELNPANFQMENTIVIKDRNDLIGGKKYKVVVNQNCFYIQALNKKNAIKKLTKLGFTF